MARDCELLERAEGGEASARTYEWDGPWVSLGRFQDPAHDLLDARAAPWVIRPTGGKAVLHGHDLTVSIALPLSAFANAAERSLKDIYRRIAAPLVGALRACGQPASLGEETRFVRSEKTADCFRHISPNDIVDPNSGRKLVGCAMRVTRGGALAQCSIPTGLPLIDPARVYANAHVAMPISIATSELSRAVVEALQVMSWPAVERREQRAPDRYGAASS